MPRTCLPCQTLQKTRANVKGAKKTEILHGSIMMCQKVKHVFGLRVSLLQAEKNWLVYKGSEHIKLPILAMYNEAAHATVLKKLTSICSSIKVCFSEVKDQ